MNSRILLAMRGQPEELMLTGLQRRRGLTIMRRCADAAEVIAAALAGLGDVAVIDSDLGIDRSFCARLAQAGVRVIVLAPTVDHDGLRAIGATPVNAELDLAEQVEEVAACLAQTPTAGTSPGAGASPPGTRSNVELSDGAVFSRELLPVDPAVDEADGLLTGGDSELAQARQLFPQFVAVLSPWGSPGRTSVATHLAAEYARRGVEVLLIDASLWSSALTQVLGLDPDAPGLAAAVRALERGSLDLPSLRRLLQSPAERLHVLGGLSRAERWREVSGGAVPGMWEVVREWPGLVVVDGPVRIPDGAESFDGFGPRRNAIWDSLVEAADTACLVGLADTVGIERLVNFVLDFAGQGTPHHVAVNRVRASAAGPRPAQAVQEILARFAGITDPILIGEDPLAVDAATLRGKSLAEVAPRSAARQGIVELADRLHPQRTARRRPRGRLRKRAAVEHT